MQADEPKPKCISVKDTTKGVRVREVFQVFIAALKHPKLSDLTQRPQCLSAESAGGLGSAAVVM